MGATFGFRNYGKLAGGGLLLSSCFSTLQYPLLDLTLGPLGRDFTFVNALFAGITSALYFAIGALHCRLRRASRASQSLRQGCDVSAGDSTAAVPALAAVPLTRDGLDTLALSSAA